MLSFQNQITSFSRAWLRLNVFPRLTLVTCFPALDTGYMFSRAWHRMHVFPRLAPVTCFPALGSGYMFSRACHRLHVFPRLPPVACFPAPGTGFMFSRIWHRLLVFVLSSDWFVSFLDFVFRPQIVIHSCFVALQIVQQFPSAFEFTPVYLVRIAEHVNSQW